MPKYVDKALERLQYRPHTRPQFSPHEHIPPKYGTIGQQQPGTPIDLSAPLSPKETTKVQSTIGTMLYYGRAIDGSILPALNDLSSQQAKPTMETKRKLQRLLDYIATYYDASVRFHASDMVLRADSDAAYLVAPKARSRIAGYFYLSSIKDKPPLNGVVHIECKTLRHVVASAAEAETAGVFHNSQIVLSMRRILEALNHPQPPTPMKTDNSTTTGFIRNNIHQKKSKSWDMRFYWLRDKKTQQLLNFYWEKGKNNYADYFTKHHSIKHHRSTRPTYIRDKNIDFTKLRNSANHVSSHNEKMSPNLTNLRFLTNHIFSHYQRLVAKVST